MLPWHDHFQLKVIIIIVVFSTLGIYIMPNTKQGGREEGEWQRGRERGSSSNLQIQPHQSDGNSTKSLSTAAGAHVYNTLKWTPRHPPPHTHTHTHTQRKRDCTEKDCTKERERERETDRQTDRQTDRDRERERERERENPKINEEILQIP